MSLRILVTVTHLLGAGHLTRAAAVSRALARAGHGVTLVSGGAPTPLVPTSGMTFIQLPPVRTEVGDFTALLDADGEAAGPTLLAERTARLLAAFEATRPDVVVTELFPFGRRILAGEHMALLEAVRSARPRPLLLASIRDILAPPSKPGKLARTRDLIAAFYDGVLVHGDESLIPLDLSWPVDPALRTKLRYTGYVGDGAGATIRLGDRGDTVVVSGGSSAAGLPLYRAALRAAAKGDRPWHVLLGHGVAEGDRTALHRMRPANVTLEQARPDFRALLAKAAVFVGQAGYNTVMDVVATQVRSVLVPFEQGRETEQRLRAEALASRGLATMLPEVALSPDTLLAAIDAAAQGSCPDLSGARLDGADQTVRIIGDMVASRRSDIAA